MSNDIEMQAPAAILMYKHRWWIEVWFKSVKQEINLARFQLQQLESIGSHFQLRSLCYLVLNVVRRRGYVHRSRWTLRKVKWWCLSFSSGYKPHKQYIFNVLGLARVVKYLSWSVFPAIRSKL